MPEIRLIIFLLTSGKISYIKVIIVDNKRLIMERHGLKRSCICIGGESSYQGKTYRTYSLARTYREYGKNRKEIVVKLGKLTDEEAKHWRDILQMIRRPDSFWTTLDDIVVRQHFTYLDAAVVKRRLGRMET